jgi:protein tyrosine phosphatase (PTP) superfamily phosphohydrolase (DUF442 family)
MRNISLLAAVAILISTLTPALASKGEESEREVSPGIFQVDQYLYRGGRLTAKRVDELQKLGVTRVVSLCILKPKFNSEDKLCEERGMKCYHLPFWVGGPSSDQVDQFLKIVQQVKKSPHPESIYLHCFTGVDRTGSMIGIYRLTQQGWTIQEAYREMRKYGYKPIFGKMAGIFRSYARPTASDSEQAAD